MRRTLLLTAVLLSACTAADPAIRTVPTDTGASAQQERVPHAATAGSGAVTESLLPDGSLALGAADAPVTLTLVTHPSCSYCRDLHQNLLPKLRREFIDRGLVRLQVMILPLQKYPESSTVRTGLSCATRAGQGQRLLDRLMTSHIDSAQALTSAYAQTGSDVLSFTACLASQLNFQAQDSFLREQDVTLVPTFIVDGEKRTGLPKWADLRGWLQSSLHQ